MWVNILGYVASASVLATFCMTTMIRLRMVALGSNLLFAAFGAIAQIYPVMVLHLILLPINSIRLWQGWRLLRSIAIADRESASIESLIPLMSRRLFKTGDLVTVRGERADRMFYLVEGRVRVNEIQKEIGPGHFLGEIGVFASDKRRTATVECLSDCVALELTNTKARDMFFQDPAFGYAMLQTIISRLTENATFSQELSQEQWPCPIRPVQPFSSSSAIGQRPAVPKPRTTVP
jgi:CRP/FNR family cyclic AMP-dependent transcriptional regulator